MKVEAAPSFDTLPPPNVRLRDWRDPEQRIVPVTDERGLMDPYKLIEDVKATIDPSHEWSLKLDVHNFYWPQSNFPYQHFKHSHPKHDMPPAFRNLPIHKGLIPRDFHVWAHLITVPPERPSHEVMLRRVEAWTVARELYRVASKTVASERQAKRRKNLINAHPELINEDFNGIDTIGEEVMQDVLETCFKGFKRQLERQKQFT